jgi:energy-coupling factor transporter ATP-binding protein EcfA2
MGPRLLVLDDPTLGLDPIARRDVFGELIADLADRGTTVFLTSHDLAAVEGLADRVGILDGGRLLLDEAAESLRQRFRRLVLPRGVVLAPERLAALGVLRLPGGAEGAAGGEVVLGRFDAAGLAAAWPQAPAAEPAALTLEELFTVVVETAGGVS